MKVWWATLALVMVGASTTWAGPHASVSVKGADAKTYAVIVFCNDCEDPSKSGCFDGAENGWLKGKPCGKCFIQEANKKTPIEIPYDLHVTGKVTNTTGEPVKERYVKLFTSNGWGHRTRTLEDGRFHLLLGGTAERKSKEAVDVDVGTLVDAVGDKDEYFAMYMLPTDYKPCTGAAAAKSE